MSNNIKRGKSEYSINHNIQHGERLSYIDVAKGIGILLVVFQHCMGGRELPNTLPCLSLFISSFHMPLFFFISGYLYKRKDSNSYFSSKVKSLLIPYIVVLFINLITFLGCGAINKLFNCGNCSSLIKLEGYWFLAALLYVTVMYYIIDFKIASRLTGKYGESAVHILIAALHLIIGLSFGYFQSETPDLLANMCVGYFFFSIGQVFKNSQKIIPRLLKTRIISIIIGIFLLCVVAVLANLNALVIMAYNNFGNPLLFVVCAILGSIGLFCLAKGINHNKLLEFFGKNSIIVLTTQFPLFRIWKIAINFCNIETYIGDFGAIVLCFILTSVCEILVIWLVNRFFPLYTGEF